PDAIHNLFCLNNGRNTFFPNLRRTCLYEIHTFIEALIFFQVIDTGMHHDPPDPAFKSPLALKSMHLEKDFNKSILEHIFCIFAVMRKPETYCQHFGAIPLVELPLGSSMILQTAL